MHFYPGAAQVNKKELHRKCALETKKDRGKIANGQ